MKLSLIEFSVENFKIFKEKVTFSMHTRKGGNTFESNGEHLLRTSMIYGPNASGKTTLLDAFKLVQILIRGKGENMPKDFSFRFFEGKKSPTSFEVIFSLDKKVYVYSFSVKNGIILEEMLKDITEENSDKDILFQRINKNIELFGELKNKKEEDIKEKVTDSKLFLNALSEWNSELAMNIVKGFWGLNIIAGIEDNFRQYTVNFAKEESKKEKLLNMLGVADFSIQNIEVEEKDIPSEVIEKLKEIVNVENLPRTGSTVSFSHKKFDSNGKEIGIEILDSSEESNGTNKFFNILGPIVDTLENGKVLLIDEFDNSLHPHLTKFIVNLFETPEHNKKNAQLIVTTHDTSLLSYRENFDRANFWFTEKDNMGAARLFSLSEFKTDVRNDTEYEKKYLAGRFGAIPFIDEL